MIRQYEGREGHGLLPPNNLDDNEIIRSVLRDSDSNSSENQNLVHGMCEKVSQSLALNSSEHRVLQNFLSSTKKLSEIMEGKADVHCLLSLNDPGIVRGMQAIAPIYSELFLRVVDRRKLASDIASHALSDTFHIARRVLELENSGHPCRSPLPRASFPQNVVLPIWLSHETSEQETTTTKNISHLHLDQ